MSIGKKIAHKAEAAKGAAKKYFGRATGNTRLAHRGTRRSVQGQHQTGRGQGQRRLQTLTPRPYRYLYPSVIETR